jgi:adenosylcobinamide-phosphate synthase
MAAALGVRLAGPRVYGGVTVADGWMGSDGRDRVTTADIRCGVRLAWRAWWLASGLVASLLLGWLLSHS